MTEEKKSRLTWGILLLVGALGCASLRNNPALGIHPTAVLVIQGLIFVCILSAVRVSDWKIALLISVVTPVYLWLQRFLDGYMVPVEILVCAVMTGLMAVLLRGRWPWWSRVLALALPTFAVMLLGSTVAIWLVKRESLQRSLIVAWNAVLYSGLGILGAALVCMPWRRR